MVAAKAPLWTRDFSLLVMGALLQGCAFYFLLPALPLLIVDVLSGTEHDVGVILGAFSLSAVVVRPFMGYLLDRFGRRGLQLGASALFTLLMVVYLYASTLDQLFWVRLAHGVSWGLIGIASATVAADLAPSTRRGAAMGAYGMAMPLALALGPMLGALVLDGAHYERLFLVCTGLCVASFVCLFAVRTPKVSNPKARFRVRDAYDLRVVRLFVFMLILCLGYGAWINFVPLYARELGFGSSAPIYSVYACAVVAVRPFGGRIYDRGGPRLPVVLGLLCVAAGWAATGLAPLPWVAVLGSVGLGLGFGVVMPAFNAMAIDLVEPERRGAANALIFTSYDLGIAGGAFAFGALGELAGLSVVFVVAALMALLALALFTLWTLPHFVSHRQVDPTSSVALSGASKRTA